jgi:hypothetical protein
LIPFHDSNCLPFVAYYNTEFRDSKKHIQQQIDTLEKDPDRDVRDNVFSAFSEKEKTESPSSDDLSDDQPAAEPFAIDEVGESLPPPPTIEVKEVADDQPTDSET